MALSEQDRLHVFVLAKQRMLEAILARVVITLGEPARSVIRASSQTHAESAEAMSLYATTSDEEREIAQLGYAETLRAVFGEAKQ